MRRVRDAAATPRKLNLRHQSRRGTKIVVCGQFQVCVKYAGGLQHVEQAGSALTRTAWASVAQMALLAAFGLSIPPLPEPVLGAEPVTYWLWILTDDEAYMTDSFNTLEECRRAKPRAKPMFEGNPDMLCLKTSPRGPGPFYMYTRRGESLVRLQGVPEFSSLEKCSRSAKYLRRGGMPAPCAPDELVERP